MTRRQPWQGTADCLTGVRGWALGLAGRIDEAQRCSASCEKRAAEQKVDPVAFAYAYSGLGDREHAIAWLRKAYQERSAETIFLRTPPWDNLRSDPGFIELMHDIGLPID